MDKQVERIKIEIEKLIKQLEMDDKETKHPFITISIRERIATLEEVLEIIDSIPQESVSEELEDTAKNYAFTMNGEDEVLKYEAFKAGANWQEKRDHDHCQTCEKSRDAVFAEGIKYAMEQMFKYSYNGVIIPTNYEKTEFCIDPDGEEECVLKLMEDQGLKEWDKVRVIVIKEK